jgi:hypothetical protein
MSQCLLVGKKALAAQILPQLLKAELNNSRQPDKSRLWNVRRRGACQVWECGTYTHASVTHQRRGCAVHRRVLIGCQTNPGCETNLHRTTVCHRVSCHSLSGRRQILQSDAWMLHDCVASTRCFRLQCCHDARSCYWSRRRETVVIGRYVVKTELWLVHRTNKWCAVVQHTNLVAFWLANDL